MLLSHKHNIDDIIIEKLAQKPYITGPQLVALVASARGRVAKQSVYTALDTLIADEIVTKLGSEYLLSKVWINRIYGLLGAYNVQKIPNESIFDLSDGESISYHFPSLLSCDTYWEHIVNTLIETTPSDKPLIFWNPHEWFRIARYVVERDIFDSFVRNEKYAFFITRGTSPLDRDFKVSWRNSHCAINTDDELKLANNCYMNLFDDFIIEVFLDQEMTNKIEQYFQTTTTVTLENTHILEKLITDKHSIRMKISKNAKRAAKLRKRLLRDFYVPEHLQQ